mmetsp:Transcript_143569/g.459208  ORF Transcript_143569/g.459208 Transcript_143569/m.459208 type:complete len:322 (+) Transcript_143569:292-1257(+)
MHHRGQVAAEGGVRLATARLDPGQHATQGAHDPALGIGAELLQGACAEAAADDRLTLGTNIFWRVQGALYKMHNQELEDRVVGATCHQDDGLREQVQGLQTPRHGVSKHDRPRSGGPAAGRSAASRRRRRGPGGETSNRLDDGVELRRAGTLLRRASCAGGRGRRRAGRLVGEGLASVIGAGASREAGELVSGGPQRQDQYSLVQGAHAGILCGLFHLVEPAVQHRLQRLAQTQHVAHRGSGARAAEESGDEASERLQGLRAMCSAVCTRPHARHLPGDPLREPQALRRARGVVDERGAEAGDRLGPQGEAAQLCGAREAE